MREGRREGPGDIHAERAPTDTDGAEKELADEQLLEVWKRTVGGVKEGTLRLHADANSLREDIRKRLGR